MNAELFFAIRCEELPAGMVRPALEGLRDRVLDAIEGVEHGAVHLFATPRRLAVSIEAVASNRPSTTTVVTGPPADRAFDADGVPTKTGAGFARGKGADPSELTIVELPKRGRVAALTVTEGGESVVELVTEQLTAIIEGIPFQKSMRWGSGSLRFGRPLHEIICTWNGVPMTGAVHGIELGNTTLGHRLCPGEIRVTGAEDYVAGLREAHVEPMLDVREQKILGLLEEATAALGSDPIEDAELLEEVLHLVEWPMLVIGTFDEDLLELPPRLLVTSMKVHQRYFPVYKDGVLTNRFVVISNNPFGDAALIAAGNARVIRARFYDARFFLAEDKKQRLEEHASALPRMRWIRGLGTMADKATRLGTLSRALAPQFGAESEAAAQAGQLSKADLATQMVGEFPKLQGHVGNLYAQHEGAPEAVAHAIEEHYLPKYAGDDLPTTPEGRVVALADRLDALAACFGIGLIPKGGDPQGLRRAALGIVQILRDANAASSLEGLFGLAVDTVHQMAEGEPFDKWTAAQGTGPQASERAAMVKQLAEFTLTRFKAWHVSQGTTPDLVDAAVAVGGDDVVMLDRRVTALAAIAGTDGFRPIMQTFKRVLNISAEVDAAVPALEACPEGVESDLLRVAMAVAADAKDAASTGDFDAALTHILRLQGPVEAFFDGVMVNDDDPAIRARRQGILSAVGHIFSGLYDFRRISTR